MSQFKLYYKLYNLLLTDYTITCSSFQSYVAFPNIEKQVCITSFEILKVQNILCKKERIHMYRELNYYNVYVILIYLYSNGLLCGKHTRLLHSVRLYRIGRIRDINQ